MVSTVDPIHLIVFWFGYSDLIIFHNSFFYFNLFYIFIFIQNYFILFFISIALNEKKKI
jgi:hypothetical protein